MRTIKFRAWDKEDTQMRDVLAVSFYHRVLSVEYEGDQFVQDGMNRFILMQYTGLLDKNKIEIFEGDIVKWGHLNQWSREQPHRIAEVKFNPDIQFHSQVGVFNFGSFAYRDTTETDLEVIGNIYEHPELLEE